MLKYKQHFVAQLMISNTVHNYNSAHATILCMFQWICVTLTGSQWMAAPESLEECLRAVPVERLEQVCPDNHLLELSLVFTDWQTVSPFLGLSETEEEEIEGRAVKRQRIDILRKWKKKCGSGATYRCVSV